MKGVCTPLLIVLNHKFCSHPEVSNAGDFLVAKPKNPVSQGNLLVHLGFEPDTVAGGDASQSQAQC